MYFSAAELWCVCKRSLFYWYYFPPFKYLSPPLPNPNTLIHLWWAELNSKECFSYGKGLLESHVWLQQVYLLWYLGRYGWTAKPLSVCSYLLQPRSDTPLCSGSTHHQVPWCIGQWVSVFLLWESVELKAHSGNHHY